MIDVPKKRSNKILEKKKKKVLYTTQTVQNNAHAGDRTQDLLGSCPTGVNVSEALYH
jgi:hypothetical protein